jgi:diadenosine tetraphosphate (Ap4A) HIT family hydrolase
MVMAGFHLHPRLLEDCHRLGRFALSHVLLHRNAGLPWFILVPEVDQAVLELHELEAAQRQTLNDELDAVARFVQTGLGAQKLNIAAIGNIVPQLHVHVIGRGPGDPCWPGVVWGNLPAGPTWSPARVVALADSLAESAPLQRRSG